MLQEEVTLVTPMWTDVVQALGAAMSCLIAIVGFVFVIRQLKQVEKTMRKDALESLYGRVHEIHTIVLNEPLLRPFFYEGKPVPDDEMVAGKLEVFSEMVLDFYELITNQKEFMPVDLLTSWETYIKEIYKKSPVLQDHLNKHGHWYSAEMRSFLCS